MNTKLANLINNLRGLIVEKIGPGDVVAWLGILQEWLSCPGCHEYGCYTSCVYDDCSPREIIVHDLCLSIRIGAPTRWRKWIWKNKRVMEYVHNH